MQQFISSLYKLFNYSLSLLNRHLSKQVQFSWESAIKYTFGGLKGYSGVNVMSRKNTPPSYTEPGGPKMVDTHSYKLSPLGPALQQNKTCHLVLHAESLS